MTQQLEVFMHIIFFNLRYLMFTIVITVGVKKYPKTIKIILATKYIA